MKKPFYLSFICLCLICLISPMRVSWADVLPVSQPEVSALNPASQSYSPWSDDLTEHVLWLREPIAFPVPVGKERLLTFPGPVLFKGDDAPQLTHQLVSVLNNNGTLYIKAKRIFKPIRVPIALAANGQTILVDISSVPKGDDTPVTVLTETEKQTATATPSQTVNTPMSYVALTRSIIHMLYAPLRLVHDNPNIIRTPMATTESVPLIPGNAVIAMPLASWRAGAEYITAVIIKNNFPTPIDLRFDELRGDWLCASFYPFQHLAASGELADRTTVFLISSQPFNTALYGNAEYR